MPIPEPGRAHAACAVRSLFRTPTEVKSTARTRFGDDTAAGQAMHRGEPRLTVVVVSRNGQAGRSVVWNGDHHTVVDRVPFNNNCSRARPSCFPFRSVSLIHQEAAPCAAAPCIVAHGNLDYLWMMTGHCMLTTPNN